VPNAAAGNNPRKAVDQALNNLSANSRPVDQRIFEKEEFKQHCLGVKSQQEHPSKQCCKGDSGRPMGKGPQHEMRSKHGVQQPRGNNH
jgi:hypothetical protein